MKQFLIFVGLLVAAASASAAGQVGSSGRAVLTPTRNVMIFTGLEKDLLDAIDKHNDDALNKIVAPNFELRSAAAPGVPTPRAESLKHWMQQGQMQSSIGQMAVHEYGDLMVVSFLWKIAAAKEGAQAQPVFVVDTWKRTEGDWQLMVRYAAPAGAGAEANVPGAVAPSAQSLRKKI
jgi:hypothetical protein